MDSGKIRLFCYSLELKPTCEKLMKNGQFLWLTTIKLRK